MKRGPLQWIAASAAIAVIVAAAVMSSAARPAKIGHAGAPIGEPRRRCACRAPLEGSFRGWNKGDSNFNRPVASGLDSGARVRTRPDAAVETADGVSIFASASSKSNPSMFWATRVGAEARGITTLPS